MIAKQGEVEPDTEESSSALETTSPPTDSDTAPKASDLSKLARVFGAAVAPTTLITALLFYFGWSHAYYFFDYFGIHSTTLGLTTADFLMRSQDGLFVPLAVLAVVGPVLFTALGFVRRRIDADPSNPRWRRTTWIATAIGVVAATVGLLNVFVPTPLRDRVAAAPLALAGGVILIAYAAHVRRSLPSRTDDAAGPGIILAEWVTIFALVGLSMFWAANDYSAAVGRARASQFVVELPDYPSSIVYSLRSLNIAGPGITEIHCPGTNSAYSFRYDGLKLMLQSGDQYVFLPKDWTRRDGVAMVIPRSDSIRLEFVGSAGLHGAGAGPQYACGPPS